MKDVKPVEVHSPDKHRYLHKDIRFVINIRGTVKITYDVSSHRCILRTNTSESIDTVCEAIAIYRSQESETSISGRAGLLCMRLHISSQGQTALAPCRRLPKVAASCTPTATRTHTTTIHSRPADRLLQYYCKDVNTIISVIFFRIFYTGSFFNSRLRSQNVCHRN